MAREKTSPKTAKSEEAVALFRILADANRYTAIMLLARSKKGLCVGELAEALATSHSATSHLLTTLYNGDVVSFKKEGRDVRYFLANSSKAKRVVRLLKML